MSSDLDDPNLPDTLVVQRVNTTSRSSRQYPGQRRDFRPERDELSLSEQLWNSLRFHRWPLALVIIASMIGQIATLAQTAPVPPYADSDSYLRVAGAILHHGSFFDLQRTPGYPTLLAIISLVTGSDGPHRVIAVQAAITIVAGFEVYALTFNLTRQRWIALVVGALFASNMYYLDWERLILSETLALWACVTTFLMLERYITTNRRRWLIGLVVVMTVAILTRPMYVLLPIAIIAMLTLRALRRGELRHHWLELSTALAVTYLVILGYMAGNRIINGDFTLSYVSNVNLLGKVLEYRMQDDNANPQFARLQSDLDTFIAQHPGTWDPFVFFQSYPQYNQTPYTEVGQFTTGIVERNLPAYMAHTPPDVITAWNATPYLYAPWSDSHGWVGRLESVSTMELGAYTFLPALLGLLALLAWRTKCSVPSFVLLTMLVCVALNVYADGAGSYGEFYRLRAPFDWAMLAVTIVVLCQAGLWAARGIRPYIGAESPTE